ncbi:hypothetical protein ACMC56_07100 [Campylobacterota bacterium DY0563]
MIKIFKVIIYVVGLLLIFKFIGADDYDCNKKCILTDVGGFIAIFIIVSYTLLFYKNMKEKVFLLWKIYIPAMFILYSSIYYIDTIQYEQNIKIKKEYLDFKIKFASIDIKNGTIEELNKVFKNDLKQYNDAFDTYVNELLNGYKTIIGKSMIGLHIGILSMLLLFFLDVSLKKENDRKKYKFIDESK